MSIDAKWQSTADYLADLTAATTARPPEGAFCVPDASAKMGMPYKTLEAKFRADARAGKLETGLFLRAAKWTRFYWLAK